MFKSNILYCGLFPFASRNDAFPRWNMVRLMRTGAVDCIMVKVTQKDQRSNTYFGHWYRIEPLQQDLGLNGAAVLNPPCFKSVLTKGAKMWQ
jgi:hypothetical protein